jgi:uncharacterized protein YhfF
VLGIALRWVQFMMARSGGSVRTSLGSSDASGVQQFWDSYATASQPSEAAFRVWTFGDSSELANELAALVLAGTKRGTTSLLRSFHASGESLPEPGDFSIVVDGDGVPCCIVRTVRVEIKPMGDVDERFAWEEGEGDRSLAWWLSAHARYFRRQGSREGFSVDDRTKVVLVRFEVVWPPQFADSSPGK